MATKWNERSGVASLFNAIAGAQKGYATGVQAGRQMTFEEYQQAKKAYQDIISGLAQKGGLVVGEGDEQRPARMAEIIGAIMGKPVEGLGISSDIGNAEGYIPNLKYNPENGTYSLKNPEAGVPKGASPYLLKDVREQAQKRALAASYATKDRTLFNQAWQAGRIQWQGVVPDPDQFEYGTPEYMSEMRQWNLFQKFVNNYVKNAKKGSLTSAPKGKKGSNYNVNKSTAGAKKGGILKIDANGNKAIVYPDGTYKEVP